MEDRPKLRGHGASILKSKKTKKSKRMKRMTHRNPLFVFWFLLFFSPSHFPNLLRMIPTPAAAPEAKKITRPGPVGARAGVGMFRSCSFC
jgi:hypothetical protein